MDKYHVTLLEAFVIIKRKIHGIIICTLVAAVFSFAMGYLLQTYTASVIIQYEYEKAGEGLTPNDEKLNPYEVMDPTLISQAISNMDVGEMTVEEIRNKLSVTKIVDVQTQEIIKASTEKGEEYIYYPTEYRLNYRYDKKYGAEFGKKLLYNLLKSYDSYFIDKYYKKIDIVNFLNSLDLERADYMDICEQLHSNFNTIITEIGYLEESNQNFRSSRTGMKFSDLISLYRGLLQNEYNKYYANVREGRLTKDKDKFITKYQDKIEATTLLMNIAFKESSLSKKTLQEFYNRYKSALNYDTVNKNSQVEIPQENKDDAKNLVYGYDLSLLVNTYDDMMLRYVNTGVDASSYRHDIQYYKNLIDDFSNDNVSEEYKDFLLAENEKILNVLNEKLTMYENLAKDTINEYYNCLVVSDIKQVLSVDVEASIPIIVVICVGAVLGFSFSCVIYILAALFKQYELNIQEKDLDEVKKEDGSDNKNFFQS